MLSPDGASVGAIEPGAANDEYCVLLSPTGLPTLDEYRRAYELGDTGWATTVLTSSRSGNPQCLNGQPLRDETRSVFIHLRTTKNTLAANVMYSLEMFIYLPKGYATYGGAGFLLSDNFGDTEEERA